MKKHLILLSLLYCTEGYGQSIKGYVETYQRKDKMFDQMIIDTIKKTVFYGYAGLQFDSAKFYFKKYVALKNKGVVDSLNPYKQKLINYNKK